MSENSKIDAQDSEGESPLATGIARRRLIRAGLAATPVMLALKSQSVLAADICVKPSSFSSLKAANMVLSRKPNQSWTCFSHGYWKTHDHPTTYFVKATSYFLSRTDGATSAGFTANPGGVYTNKTLQWVLENGGNANNAALARHLVATFLTAVANSDDTTKILLTTTQCRDIWNSQGVWSPAAGINWDLADTMAYFNYIYGP